MKIIKIKEDHYIVVDDSEIKEGDFMCFDGQFFEYREINTFWKNLKKDCKKITYSTQPLEYDEDTAYTYDKVKYIPLSYIKVLICEVDVDAKAREEGGYDVFRDRIIYSHGYNQALEDNKEKKYTEEIFDTIIQVVGSNKVTTIRDFLLKHIQHKTEWEVEMIDGKLKLK